MINYESLKITGMAVLLIGLTVSCAQDTNQNGFTPVAAAEANALVTSNDDAIVLDVRTPAEFAASHISDAVNINVQDDSFQRLVADLDRDKTYIVHCTKNPTEGRSSRALTTLQELGFRNLYSLEGGYIAWKEAALPVTE